LNRRTKRKSRQRFNASGRLGRRTPAREKATTEAILTHSLDLAPFLGKPSGDVGGTAATEPQCGERGPEWAEREGVSVTCSDSLPDFAATFTAGEGL
jgi:hypothetical protein